MSLPKNTSISPPFYSPRCNPSILQCSLNNVNNIKQKNGLRKNDYDVFKKKMSSPSPNEILLNNFLTKDFLKKKNICQHKNNRPLSQRSNYTNNFNDNFCECFDCGKNENLYRYKEEESDKENYNYGNLCYTERNENKVERFVQVLISQNEEINYLKDETQELKRNLSKLQKFLYKNNIVEGKHKKNKESNLLKLRFKEEKEEDETIQHETEKKKPLKTESNSKINVSEFLSPKSKEFLMSVNLKNNQKLEKNSILESKKNFSIIEHLRNKGIQIEPKIKLETNKMKKADDKNIPQTLNALKERMSQILNSYKLQTLESHRERKNN